MATYSLNNLKQKKNTVLILAGVIVLLLAIIGVLGWKYQHANKNEASKNKETSKRVVAEVSKLYFVPTNEEPTVALIQDKDKLGNQEFFKKANNGDYLLIYQKDKIALIYREKDNKLVNVGPVNLDNQNKAQTAGDQTQKQP